MTNPNDPLDCIDMHIAHLEERVFEQDKKLIEKQKEISVLVDDVIKGNRIISLKNEKISKLQAELLSQKAEQIKRLQTEYTKGQLYALQSMMAYLQQKEEQCKRVVKAAQPQGGDGDE